MLRRYVEQILNIYNFIDDLMVVDKNGIIDFLQCRRLGAYTFDNEFAIGKHFEEVFPSDEKGESHLMKVLATGEPLFNVYDETTSFTGEKRREIANVLPILNGDEIIGAIYAGRFIGESHEQKNVTLAFNEFKYSLSGKGLYTVADIITSDAAMIVLKEKILKVAMTNSAVMIYGNTGTGKELAAQSVHSHSMRSNGPFISQNCAAIPTSLLESILFGTIKGSYTGAENRKGLFEIANGGTLFLDEINTMEISMQSKILKAVEEKKICRVGDSHAKEIDIRIISGLNENPKEAVSKGRLREDLFYRLGVVILNIPDLRERKGDIMLLTNSYIEQYNKQMGRNIIGMTEEVERIFMNYSWPGNVRELKNLIEGAFNISDENLIKKSHLPGYILSEQNKANSAHGFTDAMKIKPFRSMMDDYEKKILEQALKTTNSKIEAAEKLQLSKQSLNYLLKKHKII